MADIVNRLRRYGRPATNPSIIADYSEELAIHAADEIERLRAALEFYADVSKYPAPLTGGLGDLYFDCGTIARAALGGRK